MRTLIALLLLVNVAHAEQVGDMNADGQIDTTESIISLKVAAGLAPGVTLGTYISATGNAVASDVLSGKTFSNSSAANITGTMPPPAPPARALGCLPGQDIWNMDQCIGDCHTIYVNTAPPPGPMSLCHDSCEALFDFVNEFPPREMMICSVPDAPG